MNVLQASALISEVIDNNSGGSFEMYTADGQPIPFASGTQVDIPVMIEGQRFTLRLRAGE